MNPKDWLTEPQTRRYLAQLANLIADGVMAGLITAALMIIIYYLLSTTSP
jgi:hypothetical protein